MEAAINQGSMASRLPKEPQDAARAWPAMPEKKLSKKASKKPAPAKSKLPEKTPAKVGMATQLAAVQDRYRRAMMVALDQPYREQGDQIRGALAILLSEKAALGVEDGEEAPEASE